MLIRYFLPVVVIVGLIYSLYLAVSIPPSAPTLPILFPPATSPYVHSIAAAGMVEPLSGNISVGTPFNEIIVGVYCDEGDIVNQGDILFELDVRAFEAQKNMALASLEAAKTAFENNKKQYSFYQRLKDVRAVSEQTYQQAYYAYQESEKAVIVAEKTLRAAEVNIERSIIRAPITGQIFQVNIHPGEIAPVIPFISDQTLWSTAVNGTLVLMGSISPLRLRVDINEEDIWRFDKKGRATAYVRGNRQIHYPLQFNYISPYVIPKTSFTGMTNERADTRVLQVVYLFDEEDRPVYSGQVLDVFIECSSIEESTQ